MPRAGQRVRAVDFTDAQVSVQTTSGTTTSTSYTATLTGGTACSCVFLAPSSGRVEIANVAQMSNSGSTFVYCAFEVRTGSSVGSGTVVFAASDDEALIVAGSNAFRFGLQRVLSGLTPGASYNVRQVFKVQSPGTGTYSRKVLAVKPLP